MPSMPMSPGPPRTVSAWRPGPIPHTAFDNLCLDFANSEITNHRARSSTYDRLATVEWRRWFLNRWQLEAPANPSSDSLAQLQVLRSSLRTLLQSHAINDPGELRRFNSFLRKRGYIWQASASAHRDSPTGFKMQLLPTNAGWDGVIARIITSLAELVESGKIYRGKHCENSNCAFVFLDESPNQTRRWCDANLCGNLVKVREFRARRRLGRRPPSTSKSRRIKAAGEPRVIRRRPTKQRVRRA
jgi:predicted RNA-binding Zn ribbon-like protein